MKIEMNDNVKRKCQDAGQRDGNAPSPRDRRNVFFIINIVYFIIDGGDSRYVVLNHRS